MLELVEDRTTYTTDDEVEFLFALADKGNYAAIRTLRQAYKTRDWTGEDMDVDPVRVNFAIDFILERREMVA